MEDVVVKVFKVGAEVASESIFSPVTAAEAKDGLRDTSAAWVGKLTEPNRSTGLVGRRQLTPGATYHLHLQEQPSQPDVATKLDNLVEGQNKMVEGQNKMTSLLEARMVRKYTFSQGKEGKSEAVQAAAGSYQIKDIRKDYKLSFTCSTPTAEYQFNGGADAVIVPYGELQWQLQTRAIIGWKTPTSLITVTSGEQQRTLELLGTLHHSNHPALVVSTDGVNFVIFQPFGDAVRYFQSLDDRQPGYITPHDAMRFLARQLVTVASPEPAFSYKQLQSLSASHAELRQEALILCASHKGEACPPAVAAAQCRLQTVGPPAVAAVDPPNPPPPPPPPPPRGTSDYRGSDPIGSDTKGSDTNGNRKG
ncbi:hypothetical protein WJX75_000120 [Coccomyxa subellipsoidea]|uniref:EF-hand domain-containing protein n=1 Tax=Coccomyxa subellipsoidea TaxID=248742 RepID=A0ABR2YAN2_9CHLO